LIRKILHSVATDLWKSENRTSNLTKYAQMQKTPGWEVHQKLLVLIANKMAEYLMSAKYTNLSIEEKDAQQRACHYTKEIIDFLFDPFKGSKNYIRSQKQGATTTQPKGK
jgi:hypothetical protein